MDDGGTRPGLLVGDTAPDFALPNQFGEPISLAQLRGSPAFLVFYPFAFSGVCTGELRELRDGRADFDAAGVRLVGISVDSKYTLRAYSQQENFSFDLLADFWPHGEVAQRFGAFDSLRGMARRASFLLNAHGVVVDSFSTPTGQARPLARYHQAMQRL